MQLQTPDRRVGFSVMVCTNENGKLRAEILDAAGNSVWLFQCDRRHGRVIDLRSRCAVQFRSLDRSTIRAIGIELDGNTLFRILDVMSSKSMNLPDSLCLNRNTTLSLVPDSESGLQAVVLYNQDLDLEVRLTWMQLPDLRIEGCLDRTDTEEYEECDSSEIRRLLEEWIR